MVIWLTNGRTPKNLKEVHESLHSRNETISTANRQAGNVSRQPAEVSRFVPDGNCAMAAQAAQRQLKTKKLVASEGVHLTFILKLTRGGVTSNTPVTPNVTP
jgi:hypothetical protein